MAQKRLTTPADRDRIQSRAALKRKHAGKTPDQITQADVLEWARVHMLEELKISG